ncbi:MAG TPA: OsmC family protein [Gemmatimonadales bacterium]|nr:OsmC family protein [Gemmatimonadales bacterium]
MALEWLGDLRFEGAESGGPTMLLDADGVEAPGPMAALLLAAAACSGADVVSILGKMRVKLEACRIEVAGVRREIEPRRYTSVHFTFELKGAALDEAKARRAIDLSLTRYCSVVHSLAPDIAIAYELRLT